MTYRMNQIEITFMETNHTEFLVTFGVSSLWDVNMEHCSIESATHLKLKKHYFEPEFCRRMTNPQKVENS